MNVKDLQYKDIVELFNDPNFRIVLTDEFDIDEENNSFVPDEDSNYITFRCISKIWREDPSGNYQIIYNPKVNFFREQEEDIERW